MFSECLANTLDNATFNLSLMREWINDRTDILRGDQLPQPHLPSFWINLYLGNLGAEGGNFYGFSRQVTASAGQRNRPVCCRPRGQCC